MATIVTRAPMCKTGLQVVRLCAIKGTGRTYDVLIRHNN